MLYLFFIGCCVGSFIQVVSVRFPLKEDYITGHFKCPYCDHDLGYLDLIPLLSFIFLKGKCRYCNHKISIRYFITELLSGLMFICLYHLFGFTSNLILMLALFEILLCISLIDVDHLIIYDSFLFVCCLLSILSLFINTELALSMRLLGFFMMLIPLSILYMAKPNGLGYGDVKLLAILGFMVGFPCIMVGLFIAVLSCLVYALMMIYIRHVDRSTPIGFAPFISFGVLTSSLMYPLWQPLLPIYFDLFTFL